MDVVSEALAMASAIEEEREAAAAALAATEKARVDPRVLMQAVLQDTGDVVGAVMAAYDTVLPPYEEAEEEDDDEDEEKDEESDKVGEADGNKRPRARRRKIDPDSLAVGAAVGDSGQELVAAAERVKQESERLKKRAERFGTKVHKAGLKSVLSKSEKQRLELQTEASGFVTGFDPSSAEEAAKRAARAQKYGVELFDYARARTQAAGLTEEEAAAIQASRERAKRFGVATEADRAAAALAAEALADDWTSDEAQWADAVTREHVIHLRSPRYLAASSKDIESYFVGFGVSWIEWLNGLSLNVLFEDKFTAARALETLSQPIMPVEGIPAVNGRWRISVAPLKKLTTDKYAPKGSETTLLMRLATSKDSKEKAKRTAGAGSHGTAAWVRYCKLHGANPNAYNPYRAQWELKFAAAGVAAQQQMLSDSAVTRAIAATPAVVSSPAAAAAPDPSLPVVVPSRTRVPIVLKKREKPNNKRGRGEDGAALLNDPETQSILAALSSGGGFVFAPSAPLPSPAAVEEGDVDVGEGEEGVEEGEGVPAAAAGSDLATAADVDIDALLAQTETPMVVGDAAEINAELEALLG